MRRQDCFVGMHVNVKITHPFPRATELHGVIREMATEDCFMDWSFENQAPALQALLPASVGYEQLVSRIPWETGEVQAPAAHGREQADTWRPPGFSSPPIPSGPVSLTVQDPAGFWQRLWERFEQKRRDRAHLVEQLRAVDAEVETLKKAAANHLSTLYAIDGVPHGD